MFCLWQQKLHMNLAHMLSLSRFAQPKGLHRCWVKKRSSSLALARLSPNSRGLGPPRLPVKFAV